MIKYGNVFALALLQCVHKINITKDYGPLVIPQKDLADFKYKTGIN